MNDSTQKLGLPALVALVVGSMVGAGVFSLPATFGRATGGLGALIAWAIAGTGMLMLAFVFQNVAIRKPELDAGVYAYARAGFGNYMGFLSALGFWAGSCVGNVSYFILIKATLGAFFPVFGDGNTVVAIAVSSVLLWGFYFLIIKGVKEAAGINTIVTIAKIVPLVVFLIVILFFFDSSIFSANFFGNIAPAGTAGVDLVHLNQYGYAGHSALEMVQASSAQDSLFTQVRNTMLVTVFVFLGIEGASVYSRYARDRKSIGVATVLGFLGVLALFMMVTLFSYGVMPRSELATLRQPSVAAVLEAAAGRWGAVFISIGLIVSVLGAYLSWSLLAAEILFSAAKNNSMPRIFARENGKKVPAHAVLMTSIMIQLFLLVTAFSDYAFRLALELTSSLSLVPYLFVALYGFKLVSSRETYGNGLNRKHLVIAGIACIYTASMLLAGGLKYILLSALIYGPGTILFVFTMREQRRKIFTAKEKIAFGIIMATAVAALLALISGYISI